MEGILRLSRIMSLYRKIFNEFKNKDISYDFALILHCIKGEMNTATKISNGLLKDKSYVSRVLKNMLEKEIIVRSGKLYSLSKKGEDLYTYVCDVNSSLRGGLDKEEENNLFNSLNRFEECISKK